MSEFTEVAERILSTEHPAWMALYMGAIAGVQLGNVWFVLRPIIQRHRLYQFAAVVSIAVSAYLLLIGAVAAYLGWRLDVLMMGVGTGASLAVMSVLIRWAERLRVARLSSGGSFDGDE